MYNYEIKKIRNSRGFSLDDLQEQGLSKSFISKFENGKSDISVSRLKILLRKLNILYEEVELLSDESNSFYNEQKKFLTHLKENFYSESVKDLQKMKIEEQKKYEQYNEIRYLHNRVLCACYAEQLEKKYIDHQLFEPIHDYLLSQDSFYFYDLMLISNSMPFLNFETIDNIYKQIEKRHQFFNEIPTIHKELTLFQINLAILYLENDRPLESKKIIENAHNTTENYENMYEINKLNYLQGLWEIKYQDRSLGIQRCEKSIEIMKILPNKTIALTHKRYLQNFLG